MRGGNWNLSSPCSQPSQCSRRHGSKQQQEQQQQQHGANPTQHCFLNWRTLRAEQGPLLAVQVSLQVAVLCCADKCTSLCCA